MDASNPIMSSDRSTIETLLDRFAMRRRQDIGYLEEMVRTAPRVTLPCTPLIPDSEVKVYLAEYKEKLTQYRTSISGAKEGQLPESVFEKKFDSIPVCGLLNSAGLPIHPPHLNNKQGKVCVDRKMGGCPPPPLGITPIIQVYGQRVMEQQHVYTGGTWSGFVNRLTEQMGRKTVPLAQTLSPDGSPVPNQYLFKELDRYMPVRPITEWPGVLTDPIDGIMNGIKITSNASAGAPYWRDKGECIEDIVDVGLPMVIKAIKEGTLAQLWKDNPELFVCEVKNKTDRYKVSDLSKKTRPYVSVPAHLAFLFSILTQGFQKGLMIFTDDDAPPTCSNAYGFSSTNGGLRKMMEWQRSCTKERGKVVCYGDDADIVFIHNGKLYRVDPDFKQMDGSIDANDVALVIDWILEHVALALDPPQEEPAHKKKRKTEKRRTVPHFWKTVGNLWKQMATNPAFLVDGTTVYRKKRPHGLMTGVPGTTLFDTVKAVISWNRLLDESSSSQLMDEKYVVSWMAKQGLVVKEGTWQPVEIPPEGTLGLMTDHKFLGVQIKAVPHRGTIAYVPTIPEEDALEMLICQKDNPFVKEASRFSQHRRLYDRMRGLYITFGFSVDEAESAIHNVVNSLPGSVIMMQTSVKCGERPDHITLQDFDYPDSSGFPSKEFCLDLYAGFERQPDSWIQLYPTLTGLLSEEKRLERMENRRLRYDVSREDKGPLTVKIVEQPQLTLNKEYELFDALSEQKPSLKEQPNERSKILQVLPDKEVERKFIPNLGQTLRRYLEDVGGISQVGTVMERFKLSFHLLKKTADQYGLYVTGEQLGDLVSLYLLSSPFETPQEKQRAKFEEEKNLINKGTEGRKVALKSELVKTQPEMVFLDIPRLSGATVKPVHKIKTGPDAVQCLLWICTQQCGVTVWKTLPVVPDRDNPVGVQLLWVGPPGDQKKFSVRLAEAWSTTAKLAKEYIAEAVLRLNGIKYSTDKKTGLLIPPPDGFSSWAQQMDYEDNPQSQPLIADLQGDYDERLVEDMVRKYPHFKMGTIINFVMSAQKSGGNYAARVGNLLERMDTNRRIGTGLPPIRENAEEKPSKRGRKSAHQRTRLNRKTLERRKKKLAAAKALTKIA